MLALHAAGVERGGEAVLLPAPSGRGKSTLAAALTASGCGYLGDELIFLASGTAGGEAAVPFPKALTLKPASLALFAGFESFDGADGEDHLDPERLRRGATVGAPLPVGAVVAPWFDPSAGAGRLQALTAGETVLALVESAPALSRHGRAGFDRLVDLAARVRGFRWTYGDAFAAARRLLDEPWPEGPS